MQIFYRLVKKEMNYKFLSKKQAKNILEKILKVIVGQQNENYSKNN